MRQKAVFMAVQTGRVSAAEIVRLYDRLSGSAVRQQLIFALAQRNEPAALEKLIDIARTERDPELRRTALFHLGQSRDPRAVQTLLDIINQ